MDAPHHRLAVGVAGLSLLAIWFVAGSAAAAGPSRPGEAIVLTDQPGLEGLAPERLVAVAYHRGRRGRGDWDQVPVQVDERVTVDFGSAPGSNAAAGSEGTVYGTPATGVEVSQYADPDTFVGPDSDPAIDADDEVVFMSADSGDRAPRSAGRPNGVAPAEGERVSLVDPLTGKRSFIYLHAAKNQRRAAKATDYVDYEFELASGDYRTTYLRADGPNPETSRIRTDNYEAGFSDRWIFDQLRIRAGKASGAEILDGFKFGFGPGACSRSENTFSDAEGAFVANIDGPVRAIRAYIGANSGPLTERTHYFYDERHEIVTDLRVHPIGGALIYHDLSEAGIGMSFRNSANPAGVSVDGEPDAISAAVPDWRLWSGAQGSLFAADRYESSFADALSANASEFYLDDSTPEFQQCWGDQMAFGQAGFRSQTQLPNTDPRTQPTDFLRTTTSEILAEPGANAADAARWQRRIDVPLRVRVK